MSIENLEKIVSLGLAVGDIALHASEQNSTLAKLGAVLPLIEDLPMLMEINYADLEAEVKGLTPADLDALDGYIEANFPADVSDKGQKVKIALDVVIDLAKVIEKAVSLWK